MKGSGVGFLGLLALLVIALKLMGYVTWSWCWVTVPLWGPFALAGFGFFVAVVFVFIKELLK
jgi:hypothetical protein